MSWHEARISVTLGELPPESFGFLHTAHPTQGRTSCSGWCPFPPRSWVPRAGWPRPAVSSHGRLSRHGNLMVSACSAPAATPGAVPSGVRGAAHPVRGASAPRGRRRCPSSAPPAPVPLLMHSENHNKFPLPHEPSGAPNCRVSSWNRRSAQFCLTTVQGHQAKQAACV